MNEKQSVRIKSCGEDEVYAEWFECEKCGDQTVLGRFNYCGNCGSQIQKEESSAKPETLSPQTNVVSGESDFVLWRDLNHNEIVLNGDRYYNNEDKAFELFFGEEKWTSDNPRWQSPNSWQRSVLGSGTKSVAASTDDGRQEKSMADPENPYHETWKKAHAIADKLDPQSVPVPHDCLQEKERTIVETIIDHLIYANIIQRDDRNRSISLLRQDLRFHLAGVVHPDTERLDWLSQKFALANQANILSKSSDGRPDYKCSSGFHCGDTIREAIDAAMSDTDKKE